MMARGIRGWIEEDVEAFPVAPHRYSYDRGFPQDEATTLREWREALPYRKGDVIMVERGGKPVRAKVLHIVPVYDRFGDRMECYQCAIETAGGRFSKDWYRFYPGDVQRGYYLAGMAPDLEGNL